MSRAWCCTASASPMLVKSLPRMIRYLKSAASTCSSTPTARAGAAQAPGDHRDRIGRAARLSRRGGGGELPQGARKDIVRPHSSATSASSPSSRRRSAPPRRGYRYWLTGLKETGRPAADFVRLAARHWRPRGASAAPGLRRSRTADSPARTPPSSSGRRRMRRKRSAPPGAGRHSRRHHGRLGRPPSPASVSKREPAGAPWSGCRRPWSLMYFTAHGRALPCCIAPFSARGYETYTLGRRHPADPAGDLERAPPTRNSASSSPATRRRSPARTAASDGASRYCHRHSRPERGGNDRRRRGGDSPRDRPEIIVADGGSTDGTQELARAAGARVISPSGRGYGRACAEGAAASDCGFVVFMDGDGADRGDLLARLVDPLRAGPMISSSRPAPAARGSRAR